MSGGGNTLGGDGDGRREPLPSNWARPSQPRVGRIGDWNNSGGSTSSSRSASAGRFATLSDLSSSAQPSRPPPQRHTFDDDDDDDEEADRRRGGEDWFAGGERSAISVQNPNRGPTQPGGDAVQDILRRAAEAGPPPVAVGETTRSSFFGGGHTLGSDEVESAYIPDPNAPEPEEQETAIRHVTFWRNGFSIEDGELLRYDDAQNQQLLEALNSGHAPLAMLNVLPDQPVELRIAKRLDEEYVASPKESKPFGGDGNRLGAHTPTFTSASASSGAGPSSAMPGSFPAGPSSALTGSGGGSMGADRESVINRFEVDQSLPTTTVQIRLADGTRIPCRMNLHHNVGDIRNFINASRPENLAREYTIGTTFPNRTLEDNTQSIKDAGLANSVVVQRWV